MIENQIIAQNITNLTDARYFAAWGVDYISFNTRSGSEFKISMEDIKEISDWVEGPKILIENDSLEFDEIADGFILGTIYSSLPQSKECFYRTDLSELKKSLPSGKYIIKLESESELKDLNELDPELLSELDLFVDISNIRLRDKSLIADYGIVIQGGEEEKAGVKSFDDLDELYDLLMD
jgi:phosphoribosylanthranilate isomerase